MVNIDNYESYFLQYSEGLLTASERLEVEAFAQAHPDLAEELALYAESPRLVADEEVVFADKDSLRQRPAVGLAWRRYWPAAAAIVLAAGVGVALLMHGNANEPTTITAQVDNEPTTAVATYDSSDSDTNETESANTPQWSVPTTRPIAQSANKTTQEVAAETAQTADEPVRLISLDEEPVESLVAEIPERDKEASNTEEVQESWLQAPDSQNLAEATTATTSNEVGSKTDGLIPLSKGVRRAAQAVGVAMTKADEARNRYEMLRLRVEPYRVLLAKLF